MSILLDANARILIVGITGKFGTFSVKDLAQSGTKVVAGVAPGRHGQRVENIPVFSSVAVAVRETGVNAAEAISLFHDDPDTRAIVYLGEIGGSEEYALAEYARRPDAKPAAALLVGRTAPVGKKMGHAAAMIGSYAEGWAAKVEALDRAGVVIARDLDGLAAAARLALTRAMQPAA